jgi:hypothetical protein
VKTRPFSQEKKIRKTRAPAARPVTPVVGYRRLITGTIPIAASGHPHRVRHRVEPNASERETGIIVESRRPRAAPRNPGRYTRARVRAATAR